jgi:hypothetical protein
MVGPKSDPTSRREPFRAVLPTQKSVRNAYRRLWEVAESKVGRCSGTRLRNPFVRSPKRAASDGGMLSRVSEGKKPPRAVGGLVGTALLARGPGGSALATTRAGTKSEHGHSRG